MHFKEKLGPHYPYETTLLTTMGHGTCDVCTRKGVLLFSFLLMNSYTSINCVREFLMQTLYKIRAYTTPPNHIKAITSKPPFCQFHSFLKLNVLQQIEHYMHLHVHRNISSWNNVRASQLEIEGELCNFYKSV